MNNKEIWDKLKQIGINNISELKKFVSQSQIDIGLFVTDFKPERRWKE